MDIDKLYKNYKIKQNIYYGTSLLIYLSYIAIFTGIYIISPENLQVATHIMEFIVCAILIIRFHPFQSTGPCLEKYDQQLIFLSATILLTNLGITNYIITKIKDSKTIQNIVENI